MSQLLHREKLGIPREYYTIRSSTAVLQKNDPVKRALPISNP
jgi:hypothetical protein